jgi:hypothetical protein
VKNRIGELLTMSEADDVDLVALTEKAELLAEATGRDKADVLADLLDDGELNFSSGADAVAEKGILDKANEQAEKAKTLLITLMPVIAILLGGGGAEMLGITDFTGMNSEDDEDDYYEPPYISIWGCTDWSADNFDSYANEDDGSCYYPVYGCTNDAAGNYDPEATEDDGSCEPEPQPVRGCTDSDAENYAPEAEEDDGSCYYPPDPIKGCMDPSADNYDEEAEEDDGSCEYPPEPIEGCTDDSAENYDPDADTDDGSCEYDTSLEDCTVGIHNHYRGHEADDAEQDAIVVAFKVIPDGCDDFNIDISIELFQHGYAPNYTHNMMVMGGMETDVSHVFDGVAVGNWIPKIKAGVEGEQKENVNFWAIDVEEQTCEADPFFYATQIEWVVVNNTTEMKIKWDADLNCDQTEYIEVDIVILNSTNQTVYANSFGFNTTYQDGDWRQYIWTSAAANETYSIRLDIWWETDAGWIKTDTAIHDNETAS